MSKMFRLIFAIFIAFFVTQAFASAGLTEKQEHELLRKVSCVSKKADHKKAKALKDHIKRFNLRDFELYQTIKNASDMAIDVALVNLLIKKYPNLAEQFLVILDKKNLVNEETCDAICYVRYKQKRR